MSKFHEWQDRIHSNSFHWAVSGVAGFIGSHLLEFLLSKKQKVVGLDNFSTGKRSNLDDVRLKVGEKLWENFTLIEGDIRSIEICKQLVSGRDFVLHQAAIGSVPISFEDPLYVHSVNVTGFLNMAVASQEAKIKRFTYASSCATYGSNNSMPLREEDIAIPLSPYAATKLCNEIYAQTFAKAFGLEMIGLRYFNVFGERQDPFGVYAAVIPQWIMSMSRNQEVFINGDPQITRDFLYVQNVVEVNIAAALSRKVGIGEILNVAGGREISLSNLYSSIHSNLERQGKGASLGSPHIRDFRQGDIMRSRADITKMKDLIGGEPTYTFDDGLKKAVDWFQGQI